MLADQTPDLPTTPEALAELAREELPPEAHAYVAGSAGAESTARENRRAFDRWRIVPRMLRDVAERDLSVELFGRELPVPVMLAPIGVQSIIHEEAELATARAAADVDVPLVLSSASSETMEDVADELGDTPGWFQLYWSADRDVTASFLHRAEDAGYEAIVVTLDTPMMGWRERDVDHAYLPFLDGEGVANYLTDPAFRDSLDAPPEEDERSALWQFTEIFGDPSLTWDDLDFLREHTDLPLVLKGILHPADAREAVERGVDGLIVSNHGGRQVDGAIGALDALPDVVDEVGDEVPVLFDSGIRRGADAFRAIGLGADAVLLGRPYVYGLAVAGEDGVRAVVRNFLADLDLTLALSGHTSFADVDRNTLVESNE
ncbi:alpha-hydroxy-acid oxidizing protein [Haladaptatus sp. NG-WS-4]